MKTEFIWYNPAEKEYQFGDKKCYIDTIRNSNQSHNFVILDRFPNISADFRIKLISKLRFLNSASKSGVLEFI
ncbi:hypothetical protein N7E81_03915 [Reichenbachiella carrageenanivorans]|uniref:Uncharacterized protein n=1 Tax=Reichenbachiella carrageenanivorans TaxID=2979869 RepID=A0ABY6D254_9BACT|nr:hypothetical protein [Reichenbachiella carrageenanivorans]UXX80245.1 hypothetical protein N7E81_03915 [Reichenbachiella carrageenanivorans]